MTRVLILGGGTSSYAAASLLTPALAGRRRVILSLISDRSQYTVRPLLPEVLAGWIQPQLAVADLAQLASLGPVDIFVEQIAGIDLDRGEVTTDRGRHAFDYLLMGLGSRPAIPAAWRDSPLHTPLYRDVEAVRLKHELYPLASERQGGRPLHLVVVGGGREGVHLTGTLAGGLAPPREGAGEIIDLRLTLLERRERLLPRFSRAFGEYARDVLVGAGVDLRLETEATALEADAVQLSSGETLQTDRVLWAGGTRPAPVLATLGGVVDPIGRVRVDAFLRVDGRPNVFAAGSSTSRSPRLGRAGVSGEPEASASSEEADARSELADQVPGILESALSGTVAARNLLASMVGRTLEPLEPSSRLRVAPVGRGRAVAETYGVTLTGAPAWLMYRAALVRALPLLTNQLGLVTAWAGQLLSGGLG